MITIRAKEVEDEKTDRLGVDLVIWYLYKIKICVVDHSGSMAYEKIHLVRETLKYLLTLLKE